MWIEMNSIFTTRVKELRQDAGKTQAEIAELLGVLRTTYGEYERGKILPPMDKIKVLADLYHVSVDYLIGNTNNPRENERESMDVGERLKEIAASLQNRETPITFNGSPVDNDFRDLLIGSIESSLQLGKTLLRQRED